MTITEPNAGMAIVGLDRDFDVEPPLPAGNRASGQPFAYDATAFLTDPSAPGNGAMTMEPYEAYAPGVEPGVRNGARPPAEAGPAAPAAAPPLAAPVMAPIRLRTVSGRYRSAALGF